MKTREIRPGTAIQAEPTSALIDVKIRAKVPDAAEHDDVIVLVPMLVPIRVPANVDLHITVDPQDARIVAATVSSTRVDGQSDGLPKTHGAEVLEASRPTPGNHDVLKEHGIRLTDE